MDRKNDSRVAATRSRPRNSPALIVAPDREMPGTRAMHCTNPMTSASFRVVDFSGRAWVARASASTITALHADQRDGHDPQVAQRAGHQVPEQEADHADRHAAPDDEPGEPVVERAAHLGAVQPGHPGGDDPHDVLREVDEHGGDRAHLDDGRERRDALVVDRQVERLLGDRQVPGAGDGQELGEPLDDPEQRGLQDARCRSRGSTPPARTRRGPRPSCAVPRPARPGCRRTTRPRSWSLLPRRRPTAGPGCVRAARSARCGR